VHKHAKQRTLPTFIQVRALVDLLSELPSIDEDLSLDHARKALAGYVFRDIQSLVKAELRPVR